MFQVRFSSRIASFVRSPPLASRVRYLHSKEYENPNKMVTVIGGASKGIGLSFLESLAKRRDGSKLIALSRSMTEELTHLVQEYPERIKWIQTDLCDENSIKLAVSQMKKEYERVDLLINCAGILGNNTPNQPGPERSISSINKDWMLKTFEVNLFGHVMLTQELLPLLKRKQTEFPIGKVVNISARVGSISDNRLGGWYSYRMSKAALNMFTKTLSLEMKRNGVAVISIHPGTTNTGLSKPFQKNVADGKLFSSEYSVNCMLNNVIDKLAIVDTGKFFAYDGSEIQY